MVDNVIATNSTVAPPATYDPAPRHAEDPAFDAAVARRALPQQVVAAAAANTGQPPAGACGCCGGRPATASSHLGKRSATGAGRTPATTGPTSRSPFDQALLTYLRNVDSSTLGDHQLRV
jgi:hypothetical protein